MYGDYHRSIGPKWLLTVMHLGAVAAIYWLMFADGFSWVNRLLGVHLAAGGLVRCRLIFWAAAIYFLRLLPTLFIFQRHRAAWGAALFVGLWIWVIDMTFTLSGGTNPAGVGWATALGGFLYLAGSFVNTASEAMRHRWKQHSEHHGRLYTGGLFRLSMHINFFGETLLFSGFALLAGRWAAWIIPAIIACGFIFVNIPLLDRYLAQKYPVEFDAYRRRTRKFIPLLY